MKPGLVKRNEIGVEMASAQCRLAGPKKASQFTIPESSETPGLRLWPSNIEEFKALSRPASTAA